MTRILIADALSPEGVKILQADGNFQVDNRPEITPQQLLADAHLYDAIVVRSRTTVTAEVLNKGTNLKVVGRAGAGLDNVDIAAATARGIVVMNTPGGNTISAAEHAFGVMLAAARKIPAADALMKAGKWEKKKLVGKELDGKTLGLVGVGRIGMAFAKRALSFNMRVLGYDPFLSPEAARANDVQLVELEELIKQADFISIHSPKTEKTTGMFRLPQFKQMKKDAILVNCARGGIVDEADLAEALSGGLIAGAALDVFESEPLPAESPLRGAPNLVLTPHLAASTEEAQENVAIQIAEQIVELLQSGQIRNAANAPDIAPEILAKIRPYLNLGEQLGRFASQFVEWPVRGISVKYLGDMLDFSLSPITTAIVKGFLEPAADTTINYVNALHIAKERGIEISDTRGHEESDYTNLISIEVENAAGVKSLVSGTFFTLRTPRIVHINDKRVLAEPTGTMIVLENNDVPGVIADVTSVLGRKQINIAQLTWGRTESLQRALTVINVDNPVADDVLAEISRLPNILWVKLIKV